VTSPDSDGVLDAHETARRVGHYRWIEQRLFEILGAWVATTPHLEAKLAFASQSHHHVWHAEMWERCLPTLGAVTPSDLTVPPNDDLVTFMDALAGADDVLERLVGVYRVLVPRKVAAYTHHLSVVRPVADAPTIRVLRFVLQDEVDDWAAGERIVQSLALSRDDIARAGEHQRRLEGLVIDAGGIAGPGSAGPTARRT
jgi:hypothetical protein